jgi:serine/threonine protein kinase
VSDYDGWQLIGDQLGKGGQGTVFRARSPQNVRQLKENADIIQRLLREMVAAIQKPDWVSDQSKRVAELSHKMVQLGGAEPVEGLGALKTFKIPSDDKKEEAQAVSRLQSEVAALSSINHPAILKLLHHNVEARFIVTEFQQRGTLDEEKNIERYKGNALGGLEAFRKLVEGVVEVHDLGLVHRDIKLQNIFVADSGDLVLGDFGIVFFQEGGRQTTTFEMVGSHFWMAPWAYRYERLSVGEINCTLDVYALGKVLWSMIASRRGFPREDFGRDENNLERMFPDDPAMPLVNGILAQCVVGEEKDCSLSSALKLRAAVDDVIKKIKARKSYRPVGAEAWPCQVCGKGSYRDLLGGNVIVRGYRPGGPASGQEHSFHVLVCDHCSHGELFKVS